MARLWPERGKYGGEARRARESKEKPAQRNTFVWCIEEIEGVWNYPII